MPKQPLQAVLKEVGPASAHLKRAYRFAEDLQTNCWEFALNLRHLVEIGVGESDLRWLALNGYVEFADECTTFRDANRRFRPGRNVSFSHATCFVLAPAGLRAAEGLDVGLPTSPLDGLAGGSQIRSGESISVVFRSAKERNFRGAKGDIATVIDSPILSPVVKPHWDGQCRILRFGECVVKQFRRPAGNQELVLGVFEEDGWPERIDDPLRPTGNHAPKHRLNFTVRRLNGCHVHRLIRFFADGTGHGICWQPFSAGVAQSGPESESPRGYGRK